MEGDIGVEEGNGIFEGRGVMDEGLFQDDMGEVRGLEKGSERRFLWRLGRARSWSEVGMGEAQDRQQPPFL